MPPSDPIEGTRYGNSRCIPLRYVEDQNGCQRLLCIMELDGGIDLPSPHEVFPIIGEDNKSGAAAFVAAFLKKHELTTVKEA